MLWLSSEIWFEPCRIYLETGGNLRAGASPDPSRKEKHCLQDKEVGTGRDVQALQRGIGALKEVKG